MQERILKSRNKALIIIVGLLLSLSPGSVAKASEQQPVLKERIEIYSDIVTLGDLFDFAGDTRHIPVFRAPDLGKRGFISASRLASAAEKHGLRWPNPGAVNRIEVSRPSRVFSTEEIADLVKNSLAERHEFTDPSAVKIVMSHGTKPVHLDPRHDANLVIKKINYYSTSGNFRAIVGTDRDSSSAADHEVHGVVRQMITVAVPVRTIERHSLIRGSDIKLVQIPKGNRTNQLALDKNDLVGKVARHRLAAHQPVRFENIEQRKVIRKNMLVEIVYVSGGLRLKSEGRALSDATEGEMLTVINTFSKRSIEGIAIGPGQISVSLDQRATGALYKHSPRTTGFGYRKQASNYR